MIKAILIVLLLTAAAALSCDVPGDTEKISDVCMLSFDAPRSVAIVTDTLRAALETADIALYGFENPELEEEIIAAARRGVRIRCVSDYDSESSVSWQRLVAEARLDSRVSIEIRFGNHGGIMHNKYFIIDGMYVITGSTNFSDGMERHYNNLILIKSRTLAKEYTLDFEVMFAGYHAAEKGNNLSLRGADNGFNAIHGEDQRYGENGHVIGDMRVYSYFTPCKALFPSYKKSSPVEYPYYDQERNGFYTQTCDNAMNVILPLVAEARTSIVMYSFSLTDKVLMNHLIRAAQRGACVKIYIDYSQFVSSFSHSGKSVIALAGKVDTFRLCRKTDGGLLHHKVIVIDGETVLLGSLNFSSNAVNENDENFLVFTRAGALARAVIEEAVRIERSSYPIFITEEQSDTAESD